MCNNIDARAFLFNNLNKYISVQIFALFKSFESFVSFKSFKPFV